MKNHRQSILDLPLFPSAVPLVPVLCLFFVVFPFLRVLIRIGNCASFVTEAEATKDYGGLKKDVAEMLDWNGLHTVECSPEWGHVYFLHDEL